jgi:hypothetical protein
MKKKITGPLKNNYESKRKKSLENYALFFLNIFFTKNILQSRKSQKVTLRT